MRSVTLLTCVILLAACGPSDGESSASIEQAGNGSDSASDVSIPANPMPEKKPVAEKPPVPQPAIINVPGAVTEARWRDFSVFDVKLDMRSDEAYEVLAGKGFNAPETVGVGKSCSGSSRYFKCPGGMSIKADPSFSGVTETRVNAFTRGEITEGYVTYPVDAVFPFSYIDFEGEKRIHQIRYTRRFETDTYMNEIRDQMLAKYGEPTERKYDDNVRLEFLYVMDHDQPQAFYIEPAPEPEAEDQGSSSDAIYNRIMKQRAGAYKAPRPETRTDCLEAELSQANPVRSRRCEELLSYAFDDAPLMFSGVSKQAVVLKIVGHGPGSPTSVDNTLEIVLSAPLAQIAQSAVIDRNMMEAIEQSRSGSQQGAGNLDDL